MKILELFAGTASFSRVAMFLGHDTFSIDNDKRFYCDLTADIMNLKIDDIPSEYRHPDIIWASPPCTSFSQSAVWKHWDYTIPKTDFARMSIGLIRKTVSLIEEIEPRYWFIENPRSNLRNFPELKPFPRKELCYCRYGNFTMKPTDIWTNLTSWTPKEMCFNGCTDHVPAPRGSVTGIQGMDAIDKAKVPQLLCLEILNEIERLSHEP